jgi:F0F1-type ATP synthase epsilon subunit
VYGWIDGRIEWWVERMEDNEIGFESERISVSEWFWECENGRDVLNGSIGVQEGMRGRKLDNEKERDERARDQENVEKRNWERGRDVTERWGETVGERVEARLEERETRSESYSESEREWIERGSEWERERKRLSECKGMYERDGYISEHLPCSCFPQQPLIITDVAKTNYQVSNNPWNFPNGMSRVLRL